MNSPSTRVIGLYERHALQWATDRGEAFIERAWIERFCGLLPSGGSVLDLGCGSGAPIAVFLAARGHRVTGVDSSATMIGMCRERLPEHCWIVADMRRLGSGQTFDGVIAWDSFFHLAHDDQRAMFAAFAAHTHPSSALMFTSGPRHGEAIGSYGGEDLYHASLDAQEYRSLLAGAGFDVVAHVAEDPACGGRTVWLAARR